MRNFIVALAFAQAGALALAQGVTPEPAGARAASHVCGGVSQDDADAMKAKAREHALMLTFAESSGAYVADVDVEIRDRRGAVVLSTRCEGPIMLVDLPPGSWRVTARIGGQARQQAIATSRGRTARATFVWPAGTT